MTRTARRTAGNLPAAVTSFVGRRREIGQIRAFLAESRLVTLTGTGGVGKTRLAVEVAGVARRAFPDGVWFVDLAAVTDGGQVAPAVATALAVRDQSTRPALDRLVEELAGRQTLIVLDNCEHVLDASATLVDTLLRGAPDVRVLATSRQSLGIDGEHVFAVPPLSVPPQHPPLPMVELRRFEAVTLLAERAAAVAPGFAVGEDNHDAVVRLCARLDGVPLAIELAATRLRTLSIAQLLQRLEDRFAVLTVGSRVAAPRQRTLRALVDWSYDLCSAEEQRLWARLSIFSGGFDLDAAEVVCAGDGLARERVLDLVDQLVTQSVVVRRGEHGGPRFGMLETIREYGLGRLAEFGDRESLRLRHRAYFLELAERGARDWCGPGQEETLARLRADHGNLRAAFEHFDADPDGAEPALALCAALRWHWCADGLLSEGRGWLDRALARPTCPSPARANALWVGAWVALLQGDQDVARQRVDECRRVAAAIGDPVPAAYAASQAGTAELFRGDVTAAVGHFRAAITALDAAGETTGSLHARFQLAIALSHQGEHDEASATARQAIDVSEAHGEHLNRSYALWALSFDTWVRGDLDEARRLALTALALLRGFRDSVGAALMIETLAWIAGSRGEPARSARLLGTASSVWRSIGTRIEVFGSQMGDHHAQCVARATGVLRGPAFRAAFDDGLRPTVEEAIRYAIEQPAAVTPPPAPDGGLTRREREIAGLVAEGLSNPAIAQRLVLSPRTVEGHVQNLLAKLGFTSRAQVAAWVTEVRGSGQSR
jgi:predicted ATPase/DNA-binding CsgD family transcriptional regulator